METLAYVVSLESGVSNKPSWQEDSSYGKINDVEDNLVFCSFFVEITMTIMLILYMFL